MNNFLKSSNRLSLIVSGIISVFILIQHFSYNQWDNQPKAESFTWDNFGYYLYLPAVFENQDLLTLEKTKEYFETEKPSPAFYQVHTSPSGKLVIMYPMGVAMFYLPPYLITKAALVFTDKEYNSFSRPYHIVISLWSLAFAVISIFLLRRLLLHFFSDWITAITLFCIIIGTNSFYYFASFPLIAHPILSFYYISFILLIIKWTKNPTKNLSGIIGGLYALCVVTRPSSIFLIILLAFWGVGYNGLSFKDKYNWWKSNSKHILTMIIAAIIVSAPQLLYWQFATNRLFYFSYNGEWFDFLQPHFIKGIFGWKAGWIFHFPVSIIGILGVFLLAFKKRLYSIPIIIFSIFHIWLVLSWSNYWYGSNFGNRGFTEYQVILAIPFAFLLKESLKIRYKIFGYFVVIVSFALATIGIIRVLQINKWVWGMASITKEYAFSNYLKLDGSNQDLLVSNRGDDAFKESILNEPYNYENEIVFLKDFEPYTANSFNNSINNTFHFSKETLYSPAYYIKGITGENQMVRNGLSIAIKTLYKENTDATANIVVEFKSNNDKICYYYNPIPLNLKGNNQWIKHIHYINLPDKRFDDDILKVYVYNPNQINFEIDDIEIRLFKKK